MRERRSMEVAVELDFARRERGGRVELTRIRRSARLVAQHVPALLLVDLC